MQELVNKMQFRPCLALLGVAVLAGCGGGEDPSAVETPASRPIKKEPLVIDAPAGVPIQPSQDANRFKSLVAQRGVVIGRGRPDPFALTRNERNYETQQRMERLFTETGAFTVQVQPPAPEQEAPAIPVEDQPYRRLAGIVVGDSVLAIIDMGNGQTEIIRPGQRIPNSEWTVASIDENKAILRRGGNRLPKQVTVRLESPPPGYGPATAPGVGAPGGFPGAPGGFPGAPGGFPGAPGGGRGMGGGGGRGGRGGGAGMED
jgi:hypothetical protein